VGVAQAHLRRVNRHLLTPQACWRGSMLSARDTPTGTLHRHVLSDDRKTKQVAVP
jgi:hypothetical protein